MPLEHKYFYPVLKKMSWSFAFNLLISTVLIAGVSLQSFTGTNTETLNNKQQLQQGDRSNGSVFDPSILPFKGTDMYRCAPLVNPRLYYEACRATVSEFGRTYKSYMSYVLTRGPELQINDIHVPWSYSSDGCQFAVGLTSPNLTYEAAVIPKALSMRGIDLVNHCVGQDSDLGGGGRMLIDLEQEAAFLILIIGPSTQFLRSSSAMQGASVAPSFSTLPTATPSQETVM